MTLSIDLELIQAEEESNLNRCRLCRRNRLPGKFTYSEDVCDTCNSGESDDTMDYEVEYDLE